MSPMISIYVAVIVYATAIVLIAVMALILKDQTHATKKINSSDSVNFPSANSLLEGRIFEEWIYLESYLHFGKAQYYEELGKEKVIELFWVVIDKQIAKYVKNKKMLEQAIEEINKMVEKTPFTEGDYHQLITRDLNMWNDPFLDHHEQKEFLFKLRTRLSNAIQSA